MTELETIILEELRELRREYRSTSKETREEIRKVWACVSEVKTNVAKLKIKAGVWGAMGSALIAMGGALWLMLK
jgi:hypothetical protein